MSIRTSSILGGELREVHPDLSRQADFAMWSCRASLNSWLLNIDGTAHGGFARWRMRLTELAFDIAYKPGQTHWLADGMSRLVPSGTDRSAADTELPVFVLTRAETARGMEPATYISGPTTRAIDKGEVATAQGEDPLCRKNVEALNAGRAVPFFEDCDGLVCRRAAHDGVAQIVVPVPLRERILRLERETTLAGHPGESRMYAAMRRYYYSPGMAADVVLHVRNCASCARGRVRPPSPSSQPGSTRSRHLQPRTCRSQQPATAAQHCLTCSRPRHRRTTSRRRRGLHAQPPTSSGLHV